MATIDLYGNPLLYTIFYTVTIITKFKINYKY